MGAVQSLDEYVKDKRASDIADNKESSSYRADGYTNMLNKYGTPQDNSTAYQYDMEMITDDMQLVKLYEGNGLFTKIIDRPAEEAVKHGLDIDFGNDEIKEYVEDRLDDLDYENKFATAQKWARLYGGSIIIMLVNDGGGLDEPLNMKNATSIEELRVFERAIVQPDYTSLYSTRFEEFDQIDKPFGEPEYYTVFSLYGHFNVHRSRCLIFRNGRLPEHTTNAIYRYWGIPEYVKIKSALRECITSHQDGVKLLERSVQAIYKMKNLANLLATSSGEDNVIKRLQVIDMARGILNSIAIDSDGEDYDFKDISMSGVKDVIDATCNMLSAVTDIPQTILFGRSPSGENSTGESDFENYYNLVENIQKMNMKRNTKTLIDLILKQGKVEGEIDEIPRYKTKFAALWSMTEQEQATVEQIKASTEQTKAATAQVYMESNVLDPSEVRQKLKDEGEYDIKDDIGGEDNLNLSDDVFDLGAEEPNKELNEEPIEEPSEELIDVKKKNDSLTMDGGPGSGNWGHAGRKGKQGGSAKGNGTTHAGEWASKMTDEESELLSKEPMKQAYKMYKVGFMDAEYAAECAEDGTIGAHVKQYYDLLRSNGDYTPTKPTSENRGGRNKDVDSGKYADHTEAKEMYVKEMTGLDSAECKKIVQETNTWTSNSWDKADTKTLDKFIENDHAFNGEMYRGMKFYEGTDYDDFMNNVEIGSTIKMKRNSSWSSDEDDARRFSHFANDDINSVMIKCVKNRTASPISYLNSQGEKEVLAHSKAQWTVMNVETFERGNGSKKTVLTVVERGEYADE